MKTQTTAPITVVCLALGLLAFFGPNTQTAQAQQVQVTAADPAAAAQATVNLNVKVTGKGFKNGAKAKFLVTGTTDTGGVQVNSTTFVSSTELRANIDVAETAIIANFDIQVLNSDGRGGKGTELFAVTAKGGGNAICPALQPAPTSDTKCYAAFPGCLDSTFGGIGYVHTDPDPYIGSGNTVNAVEVQPDGRTVIAGHVRRSSTDIDFTVIRYNVDGSLDTSFGDPDPSNPPLRLGYTLTAITTGFDYAYAMVLQPDGKIVVHGWTNESVVVRYNQDGTLDTGFGSSGIAHLGTGAPGRNVTVQSDGKIIVGGAGGSANLFSLVRLNTNGSLDSSFGSSGQVTVNPSGAKRGSGGAWGLAIQRVPAVTGEERIILAGWSRLSSNDNSDWTLMRFRSNGATDTSFGSSGIVKTYFSGFGDRARRVLIDSNNRIVAAGIVSSSNSSCGSYIIDFAAVRYTQDGSLDGSFAGGRQIVDIYGGEDGLKGLSLQADGRILIFGTANSSDNTVHHFALVRFNVDGSRDSSFGLVGNGVVTTNLFDLGSSWGYALTLSPIEGKIVAAGSAGGSGDIAVARYWP